MPSGGLDGGSVQLGGFVVQEGVGGVEVLRSGLPVLTDLRAIVVVVGVAAGDEAEDVTVGGDGQDEPVPEPVDDRPAAGAGGESSEFHLLVGDAVPAQVLGEPGPGVGGVAGQEAGVVGDVGTKPSTQIGAAPHARGVVVAVEVEGELVHLKEPVAGDGAFLPCVAAVQHPAEVGVGGAERGAGDHRCDREIGSDPSIRAVPCVRSVL